MIYRGVALFFSRESICNENDYKDALEKIKLELSFISKEQRLILDGEDVTDLLMANEISMLASKVSKNALVRDFVSNIQKKIDPSLGIVVEGRDVTTIIFPNAEHKFFFNASFKTRAERRNLQLGTNNDLGFVELVKSMCERDLQDMKRELAPLKLAKDATYISTDNMSLEEVVSEIINIIKTKEKNNIK